MNLKLTISSLILAVFMLLMVACGDTQIADTPSPEAKVVAKVDVEPSPTKEPPKPDPTKPPIPTKEAALATPATPISTATPTP
jgi:type IV secretory pathway VirB10-like protein